MRRRRPLRAAADEPNMSDNTLLLKVEDLIAMAMGPTIHRNVVDFKLMQTVLYILARQMRMLEQRVEIVGHDEISEEEIDPTGTRKRAGTTDAAVMTPKEKQYWKKLSTDDKARFEKMSSKERDIWTKLNPEDKEIYAKLSSEEREIWEKMSPKERKLWEKINPKERELYETLNLKDKEIWKNMSPEERELYETLNPKEREMWKKMSPKERVLFAKLGPKEREKWQKMGPQEREKYVKLSPEEKERYGEMGPKELEIWQKLNPQERTIYEELSPSARETWEKLNPEERKVYEKLRPEEREVWEMLSPEERKTYERLSQKGREVWSKMSPSERENWELMSPEEQEMFLNLSPEEREVWKNMSPTDRNAYASMTPKERGKWKNMNPKERETYLKLNPRDRKMWEKMSPKEQEKWESLSPKEREQYQVMTPEERGKWDKLTPQDREKILVDSLEKEKAEKEKRKAAGKGSEDSLSSISVREEQRGKDKVLVVEKGPTTLGEHGKRGGIEVVTRSQFELLEAAVTELQERTGPLPRLALPDNQELRDALVKGQASLPDTMQAMQVDARVLAAEKAVSRMAELLTQLARSGALPKDVLGLVAELNRHLHADGDEHGGAQHDCADFGSDVMMAGVTHLEFEEAMQDLNDDLIKNLRQMTSRATEAAENAAYNARNVSEKLNRLQTVDKRMTDLSVLVGDYSEQLRGFDAGLASQMHSFNDQMNQMKTELKEGLKLFHKSMNTESAALAELNERYENLTSELEDTLSAHHALLMRQDSLTDDLKRLLADVELLREQKADRDEVQDGLRDKADLRQLGGLLSEAQFSRLRRQLEERLHLCHEKFRKQDLMWMKAIKELSATTAKKAELLQLLATREEVLVDLQDLHQQIQTLAEILGDPKAALVTREMSRGARCAACGVPALMVPLEQMAGAPPPLPALRPPPPPPPPADVMCLADIAPPSVHHPHLHACRRWCGGSHTLLPNTVARERAQPPPPPPEHTRRFVGPGDDGLLYHLEEDLQPCVECNPPPSEKECEGAPQPPQPPAQGGGDH